MDEPKWIVSKDKVFEMIDGLFTGHAPVNVPSHTPHMYWTGGKITWPQWCEICTFGQWVYDTHKSEMQCRLVYHEEKQQWKFMVFPQTVSGASTNELPDHPGKQQEAILMKEGYVPTGTLHTHARMSAFQSGTDKSDEQLQNGIHITIGGYSSNTMDLSLHSRLVFRGYQYDNIDLFDYFDIPVKLDKDLDYPLLDYITRHYLKQPEEVQFPTRWRSMIIEEPVKAKRGKTLVIDSQREFQHSEDKKKHTG